MERLEVSGAVRPIYGSSGVKRLSIGKDFTLHCTLSLGQDVWQPSPIHQSIPYPYIVRN